MWLVSFPPIRNTCRSNCWLVQNCHWLRASIFFFCLRYVYQRWRRNRYNSVSIVTSHFCFLLVDLGSGSIPKTNLDVMHVLHSARIALLLISLLFLNAYIGKADLNTLSLFTALENLTDYNFVNKLVV